MEDRLRALVGFVVSERQSTACVLRPYNARVSGDLSGKRVLVLGAETEVGRAVVSAVAEAGASVAAVAATSDAEAAFAVQRLARRLSSGEPKVIAQAIDATNEAAVRVMVRQVSKELGGLDAVVFCEPRLERPVPNGPVDDPQVRERMFQEMDRNIRASARNAAVVGLILNYGGRELDRSGGRPLVVVDGVWALYSATDTPLPKWWLEQVSQEGRPIDEVVRSVTRAIRSRGLWWKAAKRTPRPLLPVYRFLARIFRPGKS